MNNLNVGEMLTKIQKVEEDIRIEFEEFFNNEFSNSTLNNHTSVSSKIHKISSSADLNQITNTRGFYIILTDYCYEENNCKLIINHVKAIYRGHAYYVRARLKSHLFNDEYELNRSGTNFDVTMMLNGQKVNIDKDYANYDWYVGSILLPQSNELIRVKAEEAFVNVFGLPFASKR